LVAAKCDERSGKFGQAGKSGLSGTFVQFAHFSSSFYFPQAAFRCFSATSVASFHNGKFPPHPQTLGRLRLTQEPKIVANKTSSKPRRSLTKSTKKSASRATKSRPAKSENFVTESSHGDDEVSIDRRRGERREEAAVGTEPSNSAAPQLERRKKVNRRRQIDPTTCERDYTEQEVEFMNALDDYKRKSGRMFPTCSEVLEVLRGLGYVKLSSAELGALSVDCSSTTSAKPMPAMLSEVDGPATAAEVEGGADGHAHWIS
jgi:hypothetical protein